MDFIFKLFMLQAYFSLFNLESLSNKSRDASRSYTEVSTDLIKLEMKILITEKRGCTISASPLCTKMVPVHAERACTVSARLENPSNK